MMPTDLVHSLKEREVETSVLVGFGFCIATLVF
jgi:hypothetical protein